MTPEQLKASILQYAIQGKLVEQRAEEGTAEELYQQIQAEKQKLIKEGKIKKEKPLAEITEDEIPFDIPESWKWCRLGECGIFERGSGIKKDEVTADGMPCVRYGQLYTTYKTRFSDAVSFVTNDIFDKCHKAHHGDILMALTGENEYDIALAVTYEGDDEIAIGGDMTKFYGHCMNPLYLTYVLNSRYGILCKSKMASGNIIVHISNDKLSTIPIPLPPLEEQHRIVAKIEELLPLIDRYAESYEKLEKFNAKFPEDMKKSILQYAIQGKLVEQREEAGTAEELYQQIQAEKQKLIKEGKIKKEKPLAEITEDEIPFDIPESWKWVKIGQLAKKVTDGEHKTPKRTDSYCGYYLLSARNILNGDIRLDDVDYVDKDEFDKISKRCNPQKKDILISCSGSVGRCCTIKDSNQYVMVRSAAMISPLILNSDYLMYAIQSECVQSQIRKRKKQAVQANLFQDAIINLVVPLPPLEEQHRIVAKIEELLPYCDRLIK